MLNGLRQKVVIQPGGVIEIRSLELPAGATAEVIVLLDSPTSAPQTETPEDRGWPPGFFERTAGAWQGEPLTRGEQGEFEQRDELV
ncbi:hypothetical protein [Leptolyngbya sp. FACHB-261]|uniref:hypothetical protein n=1 Tax=Leptolyngbya sp. FACHB-261 TaxID=2692806 RepID=UPI001686D768|nr:hypothetical protein [Leptolyngbya sp. FACHB-261]MBD2103119.1 hypothetical protein [Leptolyngbya sp. FACHB-261]